MTAALLVAAAGAGVLGVLVGFVLGGLVASSPPPSPPGADNPLCHECRSRVAPDFIQEADAGYPECPVCSGNMLPPVAGSEGRRGAGL